MRFVDQTQDTPHSVGLLWTSDRTVAMISTWQHKSHTKETHILAPDGIRTRNPRKRVAVDSRLRPCVYWDRQQLVGLTTDNVVSVATIIKSLAGNDRQKGCAGQRRSHYHPNVRRPHHSFISTSVTFIAVEKSHKNQLTLFKHWNWIMSWVFWGRRQLVLVIKYIHLKFKVDTYRSNERVGRSTRMKS